MGVNIREKPTGSGIYWIFINHNGKRKSKKVGDKETAEEVAKKIKARLLLGELNVEKINRQSKTFKEVADKWLALPHDWKEGTRENYQFNLKKHIFPVFKSRRVDEIKRKELREFFDCLLTKGLARATVMLIKQSVSGVLGYAVDSEEIETNPLHGIKLKKKRNAFKVEPLGEAEVDKLLDAAGSFLDGWYYPHLLCAVRTGLRIGELQALKWEDIDFKNRQIEIKRSFRKGKITGTKSDKWRRVDMTPHLTETLKQFKTEQKRLALKCGRPFSEFVFAGKQGKILSYISFQDALRSCLKAAGLRHIRIHDLRHSYATIRLMRGHTVGDVSNQLGHSSITMTYDVYTHWIPNQFKSEVDELDAPGVQNPAK